MRYLRIKDNQIIYPYSINQLRIDEYNVSFPQIITNEVLETFSMYEVLITPKPNDYTKNIEEGVPELVNGKYYQRWETTNASEEEIENRIIQKWAEIREHRNELLKECDWTVLPDSPVGDTINDWIIYRQELRNVTSQSNPFNIIWPTQP
jgi:hypothetical protein